MSIQQVNNIIQNILTSNFEIQNNRFSWEQPLEQLHKNFKILSYLVLLEQLLCQQFSAKISLIDKVSTALHTPTDLTKIIAQELSIS